MCSVYCQFAPCAKKTDLSARPASPASVNGLPRFPIVYGFKKPKGFRQLGNMQGRVEARRGRDGGRWVVEREIKRGNEEKVETQRNVRIDSLPTNRRYQERDFEEIRR